MPMRGGTRCGFVSDLRRKDEVDKSQSVYIACALISARITTAMGVSLKFLSCVDNACGDRKRRQSSFWSPLLDLGILLGLSLVTACKPQVSESESTLKPQGSERSSVAKDSDRTRTEQDAAQILRETEKFNFEVEASKALAIKEFPDLRIAGSPLNKVFLEEVAFLRQWKSPELNHSNWPYLTAQKAVAKVARAEQEKNCMDLR